MLSSMVRATECTAQGSIGQLVSDLRNPGSISITIDPSLDLDWGNINTMVDATLDNPGTPLPNGLHTS